MSSALPSCRSTFRHMSLTNCRRPTVAFWRPTRWRKMSQDSNMISNFQVKHKL
jgi:hypothetical protein